MTVYFKILERFVIFFFFSATNITLQSSILVVGGARGLKDFTSKTKIRENCSGIFGTVLIVQFDTRGLFSSFQRERALRGQRSRQF